jgi:serine/threonine-protein kinase RsbW
MPTWRRHAHELAGSPLALFVAVALAYGAGSRLAYSWFGADGVSASFFPAAGVTLAALVLVPRRRWPIVLAAAALAELTLDLFHGIELAPALGYVAANVVEPLTGALLLMLLVSHVDLGRTRDLSAFLACAVITGPAVGAIVGASTYVFLADGSGWARFAGQWWVGDGLGVLVVGSSILSLRIVPTRALGTLRLVEGLFLATVALVATLLVLWVDWIPLVYVPIALLVSLAFRLGTTGVALTGAGIAFLAAEATAEGHGFWEAVGVGRSTGVVYLQIALAVLIASALALAAEIAERERTALAWATADADRRESLAAAARAERLRRLTEDLANAKTESEVSRRLVNAGFAAHVELGRLDISLPCPEGSDRYVHESASRIARDAYARIALLAQEREARIRAELLERNATHLAAAVTVEEVARSTVADLEAAGFALAAIELQQGETVEVLAASGIGPAEHGGFPSFPLRQCSSGPEVIGAGSVVEVETGLDETYPGYAALRAAHGIDTVVAVPLRDSDGRVVGALSGAFGADAAPDSSARQLLAGVAEQTALALERARLHEHAAHAAAHSTFLARLGEALESVTTAHDRAQRVVELLHENLDVGATVRLVDRDDAAPVLVAASDGVDADMRPSVTLALRARGRAIGWLELRDEGELSRSDLGLEIASRAAIALDNALLYEHEREVSHTLQLGLLGGLRDTAEGVELGASYRPGTDSLDVGGDWHDAFRLPSGALALVVGDVVGHGLDAAIAMGQLRGAVRALAPLGSPARLLRHLDSFVETLPDAGMATIAYAELDPAKGTLTYACAGHPPPLVLREDGGSHFLWNGRSPALGFPSDSRREEARGELRPGETLVLYTDGVVERRNESLDAGLARLATAAHAFRTQPATLVEHLPDALLAGQVQDDDVCILAVHRQLVNRGFTRALPASPAELVSLRAQLRAWLAESGVDETVVHDVVLAVSEAAANAIEHGLSFDAAQVVTVSARVDEAGGLDVEVADEGTWSAPHGDGDRGHGLRIIATIMEDVSVRSGGEGTVVRMRKHTATRARA